MRNLAFVFLLGLFSCTTGKTKDLHLISSPGTIDSLPGECPWLTKDQKGGLVISWVRKNPDSSMALCFARSGDGRSFSVPVIVPGTSTVLPHGENMPKLLFRPNGEIIAVWGEKSNDPRNKYSGTVKYCRSMDEGRTWTVPEPLVTDTAGYDQRYFDLALLPDGRAMICWLDNRKQGTEEGSSLYLAFSNKGEGFSQGKKVADHCCQCCRTDMYVDSKANIHLVYRSILKGSVRDMVHVVSTDGAEHFSSPVRIHADDWVIKGCPHTGPSITENAGGLQFAWFTGGEHRGVFFTRSTDNGKTFSGYDEVDTEGSHPQLIALPDGRLVIAWDQGKVENNTMKKRIGLEIRDQDGRSIGQTFVSDENGVASFPTLTAINNKQVLLGYTAKLNGKDKVLTSLLTIP